MGSAPPASPDPASPASASPSAEPPPLAAKRDRMAGFSIIFIAFSAALIISWKASEAVKPNVAATPGPPTSEGLAGYPDRVDPLAALASARSLTERRQLRRIVAHGVGPDGTVDLADPKSSVRYDFDSAIGEGPEPPRAPGTVRYAHYCGRQAVHIKKDGIFAEPDQPRMTCRSAAGAPLPEPRCSFTQLWSFARERRANADGRATIEYFRAHDGPAWRFSLPGANLHFTMSGDCERELTGKAGRAVVP